MVTPQTTVAFAPMVAPWRTSVGTSRSRDFLRPARGARSLVNTMLGPRNTSSSTVTRSHTSTAFFTVTRSPSLAPPSMKTWSQTLQSAPTSAPGRTWAKAQMRVLGPTRSLSHSALGCTDTDGSSPPAGRCSALMGALYAGVAAAARAGGCWGGRPKDPTPGPWRLQEVPARKPGGSSELATSAPRGRAARRPPAGTGRYLALETVGPVHCVTPPRAGFPAACEDRAGAVADHLGGTVRPVQWSASTS